MPDLDVGFLNSVLTRSIELWMGNKYAEALRLVDESISKAEQDNQSWSIQILNMHATVIAQSMGDFGLVKRYAEQALAHASGDTLGKALALYKLADALFHVGEADQAKQYAARSYALVSQSNSEGCRGVLELLIKSWPDVANWQS